MTSVGIRELRQSLSEYLRRAAEGEHFVVTDRNRSLATLGPLAGEEDSWERLFVEGRLSRPSGRLEDADPPVDAGEPYAGTRELEEQRAERFP